MKLEAEHAPANELNERGLIHGSSAAPGGLNVQRRLASLDALHRISGNDFADIGCGQGSYTVELANYCARRISCVDLLPINIEKTRAATSEVPLQFDFHVSAGEAIPLPSDTYDAVFFIEVLDHVSDVAVCLAEAHRILRPGGRCYITVPNRYFPFETHPLKIVGRLVHPLLMPGLPWLPPLHRRLATARVFTRSQLLKLATASGFAQARVGYMMPPLERSRCQWARRLMVGLEATPLRVFGVSLTAVLVK